eukprot:3674719-Heterocapsa_arctica.AAC.1
MWSASSASLSSGDSTWAGARDASTRTPSRSILRGIATTCAQSTGPTSRACAVSWVGCPRWPS